MANASSNDALLMASLDSFYKTGNNIDELISITNGNSKISLRLIDWFVTNYAKKHNTVITKDTEKGRQYFNVYLNYRAQLKAFSKQQFDPFRRRERIKYRYDATNPDHFIVTTIGQMAFFRWAIENNIISYLHSEGVIKQVEKDITSSVKDNVKSTKSSAKISDEKVPTKKRTINPSTSIHTMTTFTGNLVVTFD